MFFFTEFTNYMEILKQNDKNKMKRFNQIIHDLRNPLNQITILSEYIKEITN